MRSSYLTVHNLEVRYRDSDFCIKDFSLSIPEGEFVVILGESGCGKTTILNSIAGFLRPISGDIRVNGDSIIDLPPGQRGIGMVFQGDSLFPHMSVYANLEFGLRARKVPKTKRQEMIRRALSVVRLDQKADSGPSDLSSGQKQRVVLARLLLRGGNLWLLDEPLSNLDPPLKYELRDEIRRIHTETNATTVYVTHSQSEALTLADRVAILKDGHLVQYDTPAKVYDQPQNAYVAQFVGEPGMNIFQASVSKSSSKKCLTIDGLRISLDLPESFQPKEIISSVGFRPEDTFDAGSKGTNASLHGKIISKEIRGKRALAKVRVSDCEFFIEGERQYLEYRSEVEIPVHLAKLMFFSANGLRIDIAK